MRIFGLNITRQSTYDIKEAESFKAIISLISTGCTTMRRMISSDLNIENIEFVSDLSNELQKLVGFVDLYSHNKFSSPAESFEIECTIAMLKLSVSNIIKAVNKNIMQSESCINDMTDEERLDFHKQLFVQLIENVNKTDISLMSIEFIIAYDKAKCISNVDIIQDYKKRQRMKLSNVDTLYTVKFAKPKVYNDKIKKGVK